MKKILLLIFLTASVLFSVSAADFGFTLDTAPALGYTTGDAFDWSGLTYSVKAALWANGSLNREVTAEFQGSYTFTESRVFSLELDQLQLNGRFTIPGRTASTLAVKAGRLAFSDFSGKVFSHKGDGLSFDWGLPWISISAFGAYTGLIQGPANSILMSASDVADRNIDPVPMWGPLGAPRLVEGVTVSFPELFAQQTLVVSGVFQQDFRAAADLVSGGSNLHTFYAGLGFMGPIQPVPSLYYSVYGYGNTGWYGDNTILAFLAGGSLNYFIPTFFSSRLALDVMYSSGDADQAEFYEGNTAGYSNAFIPVTPAPAGMIFTSQQTNIFYLSGTCSMKPFSGSDVTALKNILIMLKPTGFFRSTSGAISTGGVKADETGLYLGTEIDLSIMARVFSDLGLSINGGVFIPSSIMEITAPQIKASAALSLSM